MAGVTRTMLRAAIAIVILALATPVHAGDWEVQRDPFDRQVIQRYKSILARSPHDAGVLAKVMSLYRRHRSVEMLASEYRAEPPSWASLVVLAQIERKLGEDSSALVHVERAVTLRDDDHATWRLLAHLRDGALDRIGAREAYEQAYAHAPPSQDAHALRDLIAFAQRGNDRDAEERYFTQLVVVVPRDPHLWVERGDAMMLAGRFDLARESFATAEQLFANDLEQRISVIVRGARVLDKLGRSADARGELHRAVAITPRGSYLMREIVVQIVQNRRAAKALPEAIAELEAMWPEKTRKHFEWTTLASLYDETRDLPRAIAALEAAVNATLARLRVLVPDDEHVARELALARAANQGTHSWLHGPRPIDFVEGELRDRARSDSLEGSRFGIHVGVGPGIRDMPLSFAIGTSVSMRAGRRLSIDLRLDWTRRLGDRGSANALGASAGIAAHAYTTRQVALLVGAAQRIEGRFGAELMQTGWSRFEGGGDFTTTLVLRDAPFVVGARVEALFSGRVSALLELGVEWR